MGLGSNLLVRDGGVPGAVVRLGRGFSQIEVEPGHRSRVGAVVPDAKLAAPRRMPGSRGWHSIAAFPDRSAERCA